jgi:hypothetical protein
MKRIVGQCRKCGEAAHPKGNVFRVMLTCVWDLDHPQRQSETDGIATDQVKVCNNCDTPHSFHRRISAKARNLNATIAWLNEQTPSPTRTLSEVAADKSWRF